MIYCIKQVCCAPSVNQVIAFFLWVFHDWISQSFKLYRKAHVSQLRVAIVLTECKTHFHIAEKDFALVESHLMEYGVQWKRFFKTRRLKEVQLFIIYLAFTMGKLQGLNQYILLHGLTNYYEDFELILTHSINTFNREYHTCGCTLMSAHYTAVSMSSFPIK